MNVPPPAIQRAARASVVSQPVPRRRWSWQRFGGKFLVISVLAHVLFAIVAAYFVVQIITAKHKLTFKGGPPSPNPSQQAMEHKVQMAKKTNTMSAPAPTKRIVTTGLAKVALPDIPSMPSINPTTPTKMAGMGGMGVGLGLSSGVMGAGGGAGVGPVVNFYGVSGAHGAGLAGTFYDLKQTPGKKSTQMNVKLYGKTLEQFITSGFNEGMLARFYHTQQPIYTPMIFIPHISADLGPAAFHLEKDVQPKMWCVVYKGSVSPPEDGTYHFVGAGDDVMVVRFNGKLVLSASWALGRQLLQPKAFYSYHRYGNFPGGFQLGEAIEARAGQFYPIEIMIGEQPGGFCFSSLLIQKDGTQYAKTDQGDPILPVFRVANTPIPPGKQPPHQDTGPIWKVQSETTPFSIFDHH